MHRHATRYGLLLALLGVVLAGLVLLARQPPTRYIPVPPYKTVRRLAATTERGAQVVLTLERDRNGTDILAAMFTPLDPTSHVYSSDLPPDGIDGAGRPTRLDVPTQPALQVIGALHADRPIVLRHLEGFSAAFPIYPDGPVTLRLPVVLASPPTPGRADVLISYMVCSSNGFCLPPVRDKRILVALDG